MKDFDKIFSEKLQNEQAFDFRVDDWQEVSDRLDMHAPVSVWTWKKVLVPIMLASLVGVIGFLWLKLDRTSGELDKLKKDLFENPQLQRDTVIRTVVLRIGIVFSTKGGALEKMLLPFKFLNGSWFGDGKQYYSWIHIDDMIGIFVKALEDEKMRGAYNAVSPNPETCKNIVVQTKKALGTPAVLMPVPAFALKTLMGEMAVIVLDSTRVSSEKIEKAGFKFRFPDLLPALKDLIKRKI